MTRPVDRFDDVLAAIKRRTSVRGYADELVAPDQLDRLLDWTSGVEHLVPHGARIALVRRRDQTERILTSIVGSYGLIRNAPHLLVGVLPVENDLARLDLGYVLEQAVLKATEMSLGTCWVSGTFDPRRAGEAVDLREGEVAAAVCALGYPAQKGWNRFHSRAIHQFAGARRRKPLAGIAFCGHWGQPCSPDGDQELLFATLEHARLAPSAVNMQPWRFIVRDGDVVLALARPAPIDAGIVMAHVALASAALGREGRWTVCWNDAALARDCELPQRVIPVGVFR